MDDEHRCWRHLLEADLVCAENGPVELGGCRVAAGGRALLPDQVYLVVARELHHQNRSVLASLMRAGQNTEELHTVTKGSSFQ